MTSIRTSVPYCALPQLNPASGRNQGVPGPIGPPGTTAMTTEGDMLYQTSGVASRLPVGVENKILISNGTDPGWGDAGSVAVASIDGIQGAVALVASSELKITDNSPTAGSIKIAGNGITGVIVTAALTALGTQGSMTFVNGLLVSQSQAT